MTFANELRDIVCNNLGEDGLVVTTRRSARVALISSSSAKLLPPSRKFVTNRDFTIKTKGIRKLLTPNALTEDQVGRSLWASTEAILGQVF
jgi:hypothetical protein